MESTTQNESIINKVRKLIALAGNNPNENERAAAMAKAMDMLAQHNLSMDTVDAVDKQSEVVEEITKLSTDAWARYVIQAACDLYYCTFMLSGCYRTTSTGKWVKEFKPTLIGKPENIAIAVDVARWLIGCVRTESNKFSTSILKRSFCLGAGMKLRARVEDILKEERAHALTMNGGTGTSLMVIRNKLQRLNHEYINEHHGDAVSKVGRRSNIDPMAAIMGARFGDSVNLNRGSRTTAESHRLTAR